MTAETTTKVRKVSPKKEPTAKTTPNKVTRKVAPKKEIEELKSAPPTDEVSPEIFLSPLEIARQEAEKKFQEKRERQEFLGRKQVLDLIFTVAMEIRKGSPSVNKITEVKIQEKFQGPIMFQEFVQYPGVKTVQVPAKENFRTGQTVKAHVAIIGLMDGAVTVIRNTSSLTGAAGAVAQWIKQLGAEGLREEFIKNEERKANEVKLENERHTKGLKVLAEYLKANEPTVQNTKEENIDWLAEASENVPELVVHDIKTGDCSAAIAEWLNNNPTKAFKQ